MSAAPTIPPPAATSDQATRLRRLVESSVGDERPGSATLQLRDTPRARVIAIASGKGGVGKTNLAVNLAIALQARGVRTTLVDLDLGLANADLLCGLNPTARLDRAAPGGAGLEDVALLAPGGFRLIPGSVGLGRSVETDGPRMLGRLGELDGCSDVLILDTGAGMGPMVRAALRAADLAIIVATPEPTSIADAYALLKVASQPLSSCPPFPAGPAQVLPMLVVNQCTSEDEAQQVHSRIAAVARRFLSQEIRLLGAIPTDAALPQAVRDRRPLLLTTPAAPSAAAISAVSQAVIGRLALPAFEPAPAPGQAPQGVWQRLGRLIAGRVG